MLTGSGGGCKMNEGAKVNLVTMETLLKKSFLDR